MNTIVVRHAEPDDYKAAREIHSHPVAIAGTLQLPFPSELLWKKRLENPTEGHTFLVAVTEGTPRGMLGLHPCSNQRRRHAASLGMSVHDGWRGKGIGSALMEAMLDLADNWLNLTRLELTVFTDNEPAIALYKKYDFQIEGTHKSYAFRNGEYADTYAMARVKIPDDQAGSGSTSSSEPSSSSSG